ncbi:hypothetical protein FACS1894200_11240 [Spirochaetia bacterium]|nr:hypothetical protein FACS1894200_11240 [Spirochaetia bacterium]
MIERRGIAIVSSTAVSGMGGGVYNAGTPSPSQLEPSAAAKPTAPPATDYEMYSML